VITAIAGAAIAVGLVFSLHWLKLKEGISGGAKAPNISFQKLALFWVESEKEIFQIGVVAKFFNADEKPRLVKGLVFDGDSWALIPRGGSNIRRLTANEDHAELLEDNYMKGGDVAYFKKLFPVKFDMTILAGQPPEFILRGSWDLLLQDAKIAVAPALYSTYADAMSLESWNDLLKPQSTVNVESFYYKAIPPAPPPNSTHQFYLVYNPDRSAVIEDPYVAQTPPVKTANGVMLFIGTQTVPRLDGKFLVAPTKMFGPILRSFRSIIRCFPPMTKDFRVRSAFSQGAKMRWLVVLAEYYQPRRLAMPT
jgi:hypothetical protein